MEAEAHLGISPGTRVIGLAVMIKGELIEWKVKTFKDTWSKEKQGAILTSIAQLCDYYSIQSISIKQVDPARSSPQLNRLIGVIVEQANLKGIKTCTYSLSDLDHEKKQTRKALSEQVAIRHPIVKKKYLRERKNRAEYYTKMFEAIAIAEQCE